MSWGGLLRISVALRKDIVFSEDAMLTQSYIFLKIDEPKTRGRAAKHQTAKIEPKDLVAVIKLAFYSLPRLERLWPYSNQTLRKRFDAVLARLEISTSRGPQRPLDLGFLRPGGATLLLQRCEDRSSEETWEVGLPKRDGNIAARGSCLHFHFRLRHPGRGEGPHRCSSF